MSEPKGDSTPKPKKAIWSDSLKAIMPVVVPFAAKAIVNLAPPGGKAEAIMEKYQEYWDKIAPMISTMVLQLTNAPDFVDDIVAELSAEVARAIKEKYKDGDKTESPTGIKVGSKTFNLRMAMVFAGAGTLTAFTDLLGSIDSKQQKAVLDIDAGDKEAAVAFLSGLAVMDEAQFKSWVNIMFPLPAPKPPREDSKFEKAVKTSLKEFDSDSDTFFGKKSWLEKLAEDKGKKV